MSLWYNPNYSIVQTPNGERVGARLQPERIKFLTMSDLPELSVRKFTDSGLIEPSSAPDYFDLVRTVRLSDFGRRVAHDSTQYDTVLFSPSDVSVYAVVVYSKHERTVGMVYRLDDPKIGRQSLQNRRTFYRSHEVPSN